jgi:hypothetical protein
MNHPSNADLYKSRATKDFRMQPVSVAALKIRMKIVVAIELIVGPVFLARFWCKNLELILSQRLSPLLLDPYDDE